ncbi:hypothetical protein RGQ29_009613 [Quercus rubra]|uniref:F-box domain-containing protein n=1 Tax=Quercus rubra TaxID=3512 RepID=A0AAN7IZ84_QUERU|nr:hypothetical protein RGQ29_009613 [Quercus rubra]
MELDEISNLPGHVVDQILSQLSIREAVRTSVLSSKWRYKWATLPNLVFDNECYSFSSLDQTAVKSKLVNIVDHVLLLHNGPIYKFKLSHRDLQGISDIDRWILHLSRHSIQEFILEIWKGQRYKMPSCLFSCQHLIHLELFNCLLKPPSTFKGFKSLKSLDLQHVTLAQHVFENLISSCPLLERLTLMNFDGFTYLNIEAPNLQFFDIGGVFNDISFENAFQLAVVSIGLYDKRQSHANSSNLLKFFVHLPHIRRLEIQSYFLKARPEEQAAVGTVTNIKEDNNWSCHQLRLVKILGISGIKPELNFINLLLSTSPALEKMTVKPASNNGGWELLKDLLRFRRASVQAEIIYMDP